MVEASKVYTGPREAKNLSEPSLPSILNAKCKSRRDSNRKPGHPVRTDPTYRRNECAQQETETPRPRYSYEYQQTNRWTCVSPLFAGISFRPCICTTPCIDSLFHPPRLGREVFQNLMALSPLWIIMLQYISFFRCIHPLRHQKKKKKKNNPPPSHPVSSITYCPTNDRSLSLPPPALYSFPLSTPPHTLGRFC